MNEAKQRLIQYLNEAHASEQALTRVLESQIATAPRGGYRKGLQLHLRETRDHARRVEKRLGELGQRENLFQFGIALLESAVGQGLALGRAPLAALRGAGGPERVLKDAKDACATEALELATYTGIERLAEAAGDKQTAKLAASIRAEEQRMLDSLLEEIPKLIGWVLDADARGKAPLAISENGASTSARPARGSTKKAARRTKASTKRTARRPGKAPAVARAAGHSDGGTSSVHGQLPIGGYEALSAEQVMERLAGLSPSDLAKIEAFEREHENRSPILSRIATVRGSEPWRRSEGVSVDEVGAALHELTRT